MWCTLSLSLCTIVDEQDKATNTTEFGSKILEVTQCLDILIRYYSQKIFEIFAEQFLYYFKHIFINITFY